VVREGSAAAHRARARPDDSEQAIAPGSPYWTVFQEAVKLGLDPSFLAQFEPATAIRIESLMGEELGWVMPVSAFRWRPRRFPRPWPPRPAIGAAELCAGKIGCWLITQPDRGSDVQVLYSEDWPAGVPGNKGNVTAKVTDSEIVLNGQSSAGLNGAVAQVALCYVVADYGDGY
jgi:hypothetical protein